MAYQIVDVRQQMDEDQKQEIIEFWVKEGALNTEQGAKRVEQVLQIVKVAETGEIAGVCTAFVFFVESMQLHFYQYRSFIGQAHRQAGLVKVLIDDSYKLLNREFREGRQTQAVGIFLDIENEHLKRRNRTVWKEAGDFFFVGLGRNGNHIRIAYFDDSRIPATP